MPQFFIQKEMSPGREIKIQGSDARHITKSLRLKEGDWLMLSDGCGKTFRAKIISATNSTVNAVIEHEVKRKTPASVVVLALALAKRDRFEWAIQKIVELVCRHIIPFCSERSEKLNDTARKLARWQKIAIEAAKQSGLPFMPDVEAPIGFADLCARFNKLGTCYLLYEGEKELGLGSAMSKLSDQNLIIIGPEGGFADKEISLAKNCGAITASLGQQILRVETAAIAAMAICQYELGNLEIK